MRQCIILIAISLFTLQMPASAQSRDVNAIKAVLGTQLTAWNEGNLERFMETYWRSDSLMFIGKSGITYGWQATLDNYKKSYPGKEGMGTLTFNLLEFKKLATDVYFVVGKWHLARTIGDLSGHFTLVVRKMKGEWKIVADHSS
ncbi:DUF4440 domain-containing protein [Chitinophaga lutea]|uniref:DUF4440 domain-containing protein n=1 Tax=Chitinophaga lutea TaxID=2488634 RepID=A0A3N4QC71_9BACT|nr:DUF4440 domain-containing protein [Chitinophaga lutea]RPE13570.1 DUF4440 domain-containing protein [Chitinophaga lutea]